MRKLCPNFDREDGLDTVLEVPIPEEMFASGGNSRGHKSLCTTMKAWMRSHHSHVARSAPSPLGRGAELQLMLGVIGAPLVPLPVQTHKFSFSHHLKEDPMEVSMAKYIVQQYIAASGGEQALNSVSSMFAMGKVRMTATEFRTGNGDNTGHANKKATKGGDGGEMGGFVLWQKKPDLWCLELVVAGCKISAGSDGKVAWRQTPWHQSHASRGPPRPLRRTLQVPFAQRIGRAIKLSQQGKEVDDSVRNSQAPSSYFQQLYVPVKSALPPSEWLTPCYGR